MESLTIYLLRTTRPLLPGNCVRLPGGGLPTPSLLSRALTSAARRGFCRGCGQWGGHPQPACDQKTIKKKKCLNFEE